MLQGAQKPVSVTPPGFEDASPAFYQLVGGLMLIGRHFRSGTRRLAAISFSPCQNASSRLTLVLWLPMMMERFTMDDFMALLP